MTMNDDLSEIVVNCLHALCSALSVEHSLMMTDKLLNKIVSLCLILEILMKIVILNGMLLLNFTVNLTPQPFILIKHAPNYESMQLKT